MRDTPVTTLRAQRQTRAGETRNAREMRYRVTRLRVSAGAADFEDLDVLVDRIGNASARADMRRRVERLAAAAAR